MSGRRMRTGPVGQLPVQPLPPHKMRTGPVSPIPLRQNPGGKMRTGPVAPLFPVDPGSVSGSPSTGNPNQRIKAQHTDSFLAAFVVQPDPLTVLLDNGSSDPVRGVPGTLVSVTALIPGQKVWVQLHDRRVIVLGAFGGRSPWAPVEILDGFASRGPEYDPMVMLDSSGMVHFKGQMSNTGMSAIPTGGPSTPILQIPDGYRPESEARWSGFATLYPSITFGGWIARSDGRLYFRNDTNLSTAQRVPADHWCIRVDPWVPVPAQPF